MHVSLNKLLPTTGGNTLLLFVLFVALCTIGGGHASAVSSVDRRMAGSVPVSQGTRGTPETSQNLVTPHQEGGWKGYEHSQYENNQGGNSSKVPEKEILDYVSIESLGIFRDFRDGGLGRDLWADTPRSLLVDFLDGRSLAGQSLTFNRLLVRALLSTHDAALIAQDIPPESGRDFLTLRLEQLLQIGAFDRALKLYDRLPDAPYHSRLARAGVLAMLGTGSTSLACLESRTAGQAFENEPFWKNMESYCRHAVERDSGDEVVDSPYLKRLVSASGFRVRLGRNVDLESLSDLEKAVLFAEKRMDYTGLTLRGVSKFPPGMLGFIFHDDSAPAPVRLGVATVRVHRGLETPAWLGAVYQSSESEGRFGRIADLYRSAGAERTDQRRLPFLQSALEMERISWAELSPFAPWIARLDPAQLSDQQQIRAVWVLLMTEETIRDPWVRAIESSTHKAAPLTRLALAIRRTEKDIPRKIPAPAPSMEAHEREIYHVLGRFFQESSVSRTGSLGYEKKLDLTLQGHYVMPSLDLMDHLQKARNAKNPGGVILSGGAVFERVTPYRVWPALLGNVLEGLGLVGLNNEARNLAIEVILSALEMEGDF